MDGSNDISRRGKGVNTIWLTTGTLVRQFNILQAKPRRACRPLHLPLFSNRHYALSRSTSSVVEDPHLRPPAAACTHVSSASSPLSWSTIITMTSCKHRGARRWVNIQIMDPRWVHAKLHATVAMQIKLAKDARVSIPPRSWSAPWWATRPRELHIVLFRAILREYSFPPLTPHSPAAKG